jgi:hypothetical protein
MAQYRPLGAAIALFLPWSLLALIGSWRVVARPAASPGERRFERFVFCWLWAGLIVFAASAHHRQRLVLPLLPAGALLAGRELARWLGRLRPARRAAVVAVAVVAWTSGTGIFYHFVRPSRPDVAATLAMRDAARALEGHVGPGFPLTHADTPFAFRYYLGQVRGGVTPDRAAELLRGDTPVFVALRERAPLDSTLAGPVDGSHEVWRWPLDGATGVRIVSNYPRFERPDRLVYVAWPFEIRVAGAATADIRRRDASFRTAGGAGGVQVVNLSRRPERVPIHLGAGGGGTGRRTSSTGATPPRRPWPSPGSPCARPRARPCGTATGGTPASLRHGVPNRSRARGSSETALPRWGSCS